MSNVEVRLRVELGLKKDADRVFQNMGMTMSEAIRIFLTQSVNSAGLPFRPHLTRPNAATLKSFDQANDRETEEMSVSDFGNYLQEKIDEDTPNKAFKNKKNNLKEHLMNAPKIDDLEVKRKEGKARKLD